MRHIYDEPLRIHLTANFTINLIQFISMIFYQKIPYWSGDNYLFMGNRIIYQLYPILFFGPIISSVFGNIIIIFNRFFGIMYPLIYKNKWNVNVCYTIIVFQILFPICLYPYTFTTNVILITDSLLNKKFFDMEDQFSRIASNITLCIVVILSTIISLILNLIIWMRYKKFFEAKVKVQDIVQKFSYFIYTIILNISLFIFTIQQFIRFESIFNNDQSQRNYLSLWIYYMLPFITSFQPFYLMLCSKSLRNDILHLLGITFFVQNYLPKSFFNKSVTVNRTIPNKKWIPST
ncbi:7TM GPCR, serpentine receptor class v (Srv) family-containing protein [Strongyloides ratti]|uniref:7TM GPCR, serpentine receptor class v (Srv) family-containing protein n=1 Tax=Strongyloides ratti TaxID=34506 RepID=A0A090LKY2_STRRB|nr:7TM GPCR, serpentine receptor class v (Srv) family-containing protein [Strongyloides ratti]CEF70489.1 7TM GPCR, serpentine receptor class v (Srv) family-containing protein [Strongyloides ratti]